MIKELWKEIKERLTPPQRLAVLISVLILLGTWKIFPFLPNQYEQVMLLLLAVFAIDVLWLVIIFKTRIKPTPPEKIGIWIARIKRDENDAEQQGIIERLQNLLKEAGVQNEVEVRDLKKQISGEERRGMGKAEKLGTEANAKIVVWGNLVKEAGKLLFYPRIKILYKRGIKNTEPIQKAVVDRENLSLPPEYVGEIILLARFLVGHAFYNKKNYPQAAHYFEGFVKETKERKTQATIIELFDVVFNLTTSYLRIAQKLADNDRKDILQRVVTNYQNLLGAQGIGELASADIQSNLGVAYNDLAYMYAGTERLATLKNSITAHKIAADIFQRKNIQQGFATSQNNMGNALYDLADMLDGKERFETLQKALEAFGKALQIYGPSDFPEEFAMTQNNLGNTLRRMSEMQKRGERTLTLEKALNAHMTALTIYSIEEFPLEFSTTQNNLGTTYGELAEMQKDLQKQMILKKSIAAFEQSLKVATKEHYPIDFASTQSNLGVAHSNLAEICTGQEKLDYLQKSLLAHEKALEVYTQPHFPAEFAMTQNNLGASYAELAKFQTGMERLQTLQKAVTAYRKALEIYTERDFPEKFALIQNNIGIAYYSLAGILSGEERKKALNTTVEACDKALTILKPELYPYYHKITSDNRQLALTMLEGPF